MTKNGRCTGKKSAAATAAAIAVLTVTACALLHAAPLKLKGKFPTGVTAFDIGMTTGTFKYPDSGFPTNAISVSGNYVWLGRHGGLRRYDRATGDYKFFKIDRRICQGIGIINIIPENQYIWTRMTDTGLLCRLDTATGEWTSLENWTLIEHLGAGSQVAFTPDTIYYAAEGGPTWEGINIINRKSSRWIKLYRTKPITAMHVDPKFIWVGIAAGILRINRITEEYKYFGPETYGGGALIKQILPIPGGLAFATIGRHTSIIGDKVEIGDKTLRVYSKKSDKWYSYRIDQHDKIVQDLEDGKIQMTSIKTNPGLVILRDGKWRLLNSKNGLPADEVMGIDKDENCIYAGTSNGLSAFDIKTLKRKDINPNILRSVRNIRKVISDREYLWLITSRDLLRIEKKALFSFPK